MTDPTDRYIAVDPDMPQAPWRVFGPGIEITHGRVTGLGLLHHEYADGRAMVSLRVRTDDGGEVFAEVPWRVLCGIVNALQANVLGPSQ